MAYKITEKCRNCGECFKVCPVGAINKETQKHEINSELCISCGSCAAVCPFGAPIEKE
ncbi:MAG: 4Fe-4S binding protein [Oscillospiraceae bacterium]|jgi:NADH-quinone oxidoreductase subunit F/NADP-reducing hydrogenase subunit HndC|nr:4Fe-4S binding protein [Oscillospiraceae bacterium]